MPTRLVPAVVVVVLLITSPIAAVSAAVPPDSGGASGGGGSADGGGAAASGGGSSGGGSSASGSGSASGSASGSVSSSGPSATNGSNATVLPGTGGIVAAAGAPDGGQYLAGVTGTSAANRTLTRLAPNGTVVWQRTIVDANESRVPRALAVAPAGGVYLVERVGEPRTAGGQPTERRPKSELVRVAADGETAWTESLGNTTVFGRSGGLLADDGGVVVARPGADRERTRLRRYTRTGALDWVRTYAGGTPRALANAPDGGYLIAGQRDFGAAWLLAVNESGTVTINETYGGFRDRRVVGVVPTSDGGALLAGSAETSFSRRAAWVARVDDDGVVRRSRTYGDGTERADPQAAVATDDGVLLVNQLRDGRREASLLTHVTEEGAVGERTIESGSFATSPVVANGTVRLYGLRFDRTNETVTGTVRTVGLPNATAADRSVHATVASNETFYRGQNLRLPGDATQELYELPTEFSDFDEPRLVRRVGPGGDGVAAVETATLDGGRYAVRAAPGYWLRVEDDGYRLVTNASLAAFELDDHDVFRAQPNRTVVETFANESRVRVQVDADPARLPLQVRLSRLNGTSVAADDLRAALAPQPGAAAGVETEDGRAFAPVRLPEDGNLTLDAGALPAGLYELSLTGLETAEAADATTTRLVVVREERPVGLVPRNRSLTASPNASATTPLTLTGVDDGIGALRLESNTSAPPLVQLNMAFTDAVDYSSARGSGGLSRNGATASIESTAVRSSPSGNVTVARVSVDPADFGREEVDTTGTATVHVRVAFLVDSEGVPYSTAGDETVTVEVRDGGEESSADG